MAESEDIKELRNELRKLKPKDRLKKLKELEEKTKEEISAIEDLINDSKKEMKSDAVAEEITPEHIEINIARLFEDASTRLEITVNEGAPDAEMHLHDYSAFKQAYNDYSKLKDISYASLMGPLTTTQLDSIDTIGERLDKSKYQSQSAEIANILVASKATLYKIHKYAGLERSGGQF
jgi:hypothetical protein